MLSETGQLVAVDLRSGHAPQGKEVADVGAIQLVVGNAAVVFVAHLDHDLAGDVFLLVAVLVRVLLDVPAEIRVPRDVAGQILPFRGFAVRNQIEFGNLFDGHFLRPVVQIDGKRILIPDLRRQLRDFERLLRDLRSFDGDRIALGNAKGRHTQHECQQG